MQKQDIQADSLSNLIDKTITNSISNFDRSFLAPKNSFEELLSLGELVDRLSIINFKLYTFKEEVMKNNNPNCTEIEDVRLCLERARLKKCIDEKMISMISRMIIGDSSGNFNPEVKKYGN